MNFRLKNKAIGLSKLNKTFFLHIHNYDNNIAKSYVLQFTKNIFKPWITYEYDYKMLNLFFIRFGFSINEVI